MDIKDLVRRLRKVENMTQFAKESGVSRATLYRVIEGWANPTLKTLVMIDAALNKNGEKP